MDLLAVQGILESLSQHHSPKASILWHSAFFIVQLSHPYMTTGQTMALTRWTFIVLHIRWPKYWSFSFSINLSNEYSGLISFRIDWVDLLAVQGTLKSLLQHHSSKASILWHSAFFIVQLSHPHISTGKTIALTRWTLLVK